MFTRKYVIGIDFGTESGRALLVDVATGEEIAAAVHVYANGVIDERLPESGVRLEPDWALQDPDDYLQVLKQAVPAVLQQSGIDPAAVIGLGIDFTACTVLAGAGGRDAAQFPAPIPQPRRTPGLSCGKHHAAQPEADKLNALARAQGYDFLDRYGAKVSSEWLVPKVMQILNEDPEIYVAADRLIEAADWIVWQLTGVETRSLSALGYKGLWSKRDGYPPAAFYQALDPRLENFVAEKLSPDIRALGRRAGDLTAAAAQWTGLRQGTPVAVANVDAHVAVPAAGVVEPGRMVIILGTSNCHMVLSEQEQLVPGICGYVEDGIIPGFFGYEAGQPCVGDSFAWFVENCVPAATVAEADRRGVSVHQLLEARAAQLRPGESGLLALDWWNGSRSILVNADLSGLILGLTLATKPEEIYRALIEATAFGTRLIIENFAAHGVPVQKIVATGGLPDRNRLLMQIYADVTGRPIQVAGTRQGGAKGSAMHGAVAAGEAAGGYASIVDAARAMTQLRAEQYTPQPAAVVVYDRLYAEYVALHDFFGRGGNDVMKRLKALKADSLAGEHARRAV